MVYKVGHIYEIEWIDHYTTEKEPPNTALLNNAVILKSYGVYIGDSYDKEYVVISQSVDNEGKNSDNLHILKVGIKKARELK